MDLSGDAGALEEQVRAKEALIRTLESEGELLRAENSAMYTRLPLASEAEILKAEV